MIQLPAVSDYLAGVIKPAAAATPFGTKVYRGSLAPQGVVPPYVLYFHQSGIDDHCLPSHWAGSEFVYFVKGVVPSNKYYDIIPSGLTAISDALEAQVEVETVVGGYRFTVMGLDDPREFEEAVPGGTVLTHVGRSVTIAVEPE